MSLVRWREEEAESVGGVLSVVESVFKLTTRVLSILSLLFFAALPHLFDWNRQSCCQNCSHRNTHKEDRIAMELAQRDPSKERGNEHGQENGDIHQAEVLAMILRCWQKLACKSQIHREKATEPEPKNPSGDHNDGPHRKNGEQQQTDRHRET